ncbi:MAG: DUF6580 family putative transport protein [Chitinophagales bacterium]
MKKINSPEFILVCTMIVAAAFSRLLTNYFQLWNFTPVIAMALFSGAQIRDKRLAFMIPLTSMLITDAFLGFYEGILSVYAALMMITAFGFLLHNRIKFIPVLLATLGSSVIFFLVTNFALIYPSFLYPHTLQGIIASYTAGIPFFKNAVIGDLIYSGILFGSYELVFKKIRVPAKAM